MSFTAFLEQHGELYVFCDMDGVLTDYPKQFKKYIGMEIPEAKAKMGKSLYKITNNFPLEFWTEMEWLPEGKVLWEYLSSTFTNLYILSSPSIDGGQCKQGKHIWLKREIGLPEDRIIISLNKHKHIRTPEPSKSILIDDTPRKIDKWVEFGGTGILHKSSNNQDTIKKLTDLTEKEV
jgi:5'(3')-deoxyribonucleotidase